MSHYDRRPPQSPSMSHALSPTGIVTGKGGPGKDTQTDPTPIPRPQLHVPRHSPNVFLSDDSDSDLEDEASIQSDLSEVENRMRSILEDLHFSNDFPSEVISRLYSNPSPFQMSGSLPTPSSLTIIDAPISRSLSPSTPVYSMANSPSPFPSTSNSPVLATIPSISLDHNNNNTHQLLHQTPPIKTIAPIASTSFIQHPSHSFEEDSDDPPDTSQPPTTLTSSPIIASSMNTIATISTDNPICTTTSTSVVDSASPRNSSSSSSGPVVHDLKASGFISFNPIPDIPSPPISSPSPFPSPTPTSTYTVVPPAPYRYDTPPLPSYSHTYKSEDTASDNDAEAEANAEDGLDEITKLPLPAVVCSIFSTN
eukprot:TRINITY_DN7043_c0_g1_i1.p1 TRINITY_DN7043_c0_g1~~TRINITY_DN7043_c0_g1_i1.p1  ORF type:complete len:367 (+),score=62.64 TRINITY_DN7043_c0_g1_i1:51-1151(+)